MFKKSKSEKYNNKKSRQRKLKAFELSLIHISEPTRP